MQAKQEGFTEAVTQIKSLLIDVSHEILDAGDRSKVHKVIDQLRDLSLKNGGPKPTALYEKTRKE